MRLIRTPKGKGYPKKKKKGGFRKHRNHTAEKVSAAYRVFDMAKKKNESSLSEGGFYLGHTSTVKKDL